MANFNKVLLMGNITRDIELRNLPSGQAVANFGIAVNRRWRDQATNELKEEVTFVDCEAWGKTAENIAKYLSKGKPIFIEGRLRLDTWQDKTDGSKRSKLKVVVELSQFIEGKGGGSAGGDSEETARPIVRTVGAGPGGARPAASSGAPAAPSAGAPPAYEEIQSDDIPF